MRAPISIIIPTLNAAHELPQTLGCLIEGLESGLVRELIVTDGGSVDDTTKLAEIAGAKVIAGPNGRGGQLRRGAQAAAGDWLLFLHADTHLSTGWCAAVSRHLANEGRAGYFQLGFRAPGMAAGLVALWGNFRSWMGLPYGDQGLLISRNMYDQIGGYRDIDLMEDVAIIRALKGRLTGIDAIALTSAERYLKQGWIRRGCGNLWILLRYFAGADPKKLARSYSGKASSEN